MLIRLEGAGWLKSEWEVIDPHEAGRPRRRFYTLTTTGQYKAHRALADVQLADVQIPGGVPEWAH